MRLTIEGLTFINSELEKLNIPYEFGKWSTAIPDTFWIGSYTEIESLNEDGYEESTFILTGVTTKNKLSLLETKDKIKDKFNNEGLTAILESGSGIAIFYANSNPIPSIEENMERLEITLRIKEWRV